LEAGDIQKDDSVVSQSVTTDSGEFMPCILSDFVESQERPLA
jgi:hypothetical protein